MKEETNNPLTYRLCVNLRQRKLSYTVYYRFQRLLVVMSLLILVVPHIAYAQSTSVGADPCGVVGTYELDREAAHPPIVAYMDSTIAALGDRPEEGGGTMAQIRWEAERDALQRVRERAVEGQMIPRMTAKLDLDGTFTHTRYSLEEPDRADDVQVGRWEIDGACRALVIDVNDHQTTGEVVDGRLILDVDPPQGMESLAVEFVRVK